MYMLNCVVRSELHDMINYYIGVQHGFNLSTGKEGKYFKKYLPPDIYEQYTATYSGSNYDIWRAVETMCNLFHTLALTVAAHLLHLSAGGRRGIREYLRMIKEHS